MLLRAALTILLLSPTAALFGQEGWDSARFERDFEQLQTSYLSWDRENTLDLLHELREKYPGSSRLTYLESWIALESADYLTSLDAATEGTSYQDDRFLAFYDLLSLNFYHNMATGIFSDELDRREPEEIDLFKINVLHGPEPGDQYLKLGLTLSSRGEDSLTLVTLEGALRLRFDNGETHRLIAETTAGLGDFQSTTLGYIFLLTFDEWSPHADHYRRKMWSALRLAGFDRSISDFVVACGEQADSIEFPLFGQLCASEKNLRGVELAARHAAASELTSLEMADLRLWRSETTDSLRTALYRLHDIAEPSSSEMLDPGSTQEARDANHNPVPLPAHYEE